MVFTYLHIASNEPFAEALMKSKTTAIAYETVIGKNNSLPLLTPMSEVAGRMSVQVGANLLQKTNGGSGDVYKRQVMATSSLTGRLLNADKIAVVKLTPALGPSFLTAPSGTCI